jgi:hypothetical protein
MWQVVAPQEANPLAPREPPSEKDSTSREATSAGGGHPADGALFARTSEVVCSSNVGSTHTVGSTYVPSNDTSGSDAVEWHVAATSLVELAERHTHAVI